MIGLRRDLSEAREKLREKSAVFEKTKSGLHMSITSLLNEACGECSIPLGDKSKYEFVDGGECRGYSLKKSDGSIYVKHPSRPDLILLSEDYDRLRREIEETELSKVEEDIHRTFEERAEAQLCVDDAELALNEYFRARNKRLKELERLAAIRVRKPCQHGASLFCEVWSNEVVRTLLQTLYEFEESDEHIFRSVVYSYLGYRWFKVPDEERELYEEAARTYYYEMTTTCEDVMSLFLVAADEEEVEIVEEFPEAEFDEYYQDQVKDSQDVWFTSDLMSHNEYARADRDATIRSLSDSYDMWVCPWSLPEDESDSTQQEEG